MTLQKADMQFQIEFEDQKQAEIVMKALEPELDSSPSERSSVKLFRIENKMIVKIMAEDVTSLRATINSYLRWIILSKDIIDVNNFN